MLTPAHSASGFSTSRYYQRQYSVQEVYVGRFYWFDNWGNQHAYDRYKRARWYNESGGHNSYYWSNGSWRSSWSNGSYYWFDWYFYDRQRW